MAEKIGIIILAAGASARMGQPKQLLTYNEKSLLQNACEAALHSNADHVVVVLGAQAELLSPVVEPLKLQVTINSDWQEGMSASIRCGLSAMQAAVSALGAVGLILSDQPFLRSKHLNTLFEKYRLNEAEIIASAYADALGTPVLFAKKYFPDLGKLRGQEGAKKLLQRYSNSISSVPFPEGAVDIDTPEDYAALLGKK